MGKTHIALFIVLIFATNIVLSQNDAKIEKKLNKLFEKGNLLKCKNKAIKFNKKFPKSFIPKYYISKVYINLYAINGRTNRRSYPNLSKAVTYSNRLPADYINWKIKVRDSLRVYIYYLHDSLPKSKKLQSAIKFYTRTYKDTIVFGIDKKQEQLSVYDFTDSSIDSLRQKLIKFAEKQNGIVYYYSGEKPETGFDCSGFTKYVYGHIGIEIPHNAQKQSDLTGINKSIEDAAPGDLIFFGTQNEESYYTIHAGIVFSVFEDDISVIHCVSGGVSIDGKNSSWDRYWKNEVLFIKTLPELQKINK